MGDGREYYGMIYILVIIAFGRSGGADIDSTMRFNTLAECRLAAVTITSNNSPGKKIVAECIKQTR